MTRRVLAFLGAVLATYVLAAVAATQSVLSRLVQMGYPVTLSERLGAIAHDLLGMLTSYLPLLAIGLLIAFVVAAGLSKIAPEARMILFVLAGAVAVVAIHLILNAVFGITPIAAARSVGGLAIQGLAGAVGGYLSVRLAS